MLVRTHILVSVCIPVCVCADVFHEGVSVCDLTALVQCVNGTTGDTLYFKKN